MRRPTQRLGSFANVTAVVALVVATSGTTAYAATMITSHQIKNGTIRAVDLRNGSVTSAKVRDGDLLRSDFAAGQLTPTRAYAVRHDYPVNITAIAATTVVTLTVPQGGSYVINASTWLDDQSFADPTIVYCLLAAGDDVDIKHSYLGPLGSGATTQSQSLQVAHAFAGAGTVTLKCSSSGVTAMANDSKIAAVAVDQLTNSAG
jgi:hypothetical protein